MVSHWFYLYLWKTPRVTVQNLRKWKMFFTGYCYWEVQDANYYNFDARELHSSTTQQSTTGTEVVREFFKDHLLLPEEK